MLDVIGDIHGHYDVLHRLMLEMGYRYDSNRHIFWHHNVRRPVFIGDYIDRGTQNIKTIQLVRNMVAMGEAYAIMGNHDLNAVLYATPDHANTGEYLRKHTDKNRKQHITYLNEVEQDPALYTDTINWMKSLPVYLEMGNAKFVHACWYPTAIDQLTKGGCLDEGGYLTDKGWQAAADSASPFYEPIEILLKGPEETLEGGVSYRDAQGTVRTKCRIAWWNANPRLNRDAYASLPDGDFAKRAFNVARDGTLSSKILKELARMPKEEQIFIGHIWCTGDPAPLSNRVICTDYSVAKGDKLVAWRMEDINNPARGHFASVPAKPMKKLELA